jgi:hypothetical protein
VKIFIELNSAKTHNQALMQNLISVIIVFQAILNKVMGTEWNVKGIFWNATLCSLVKLTAVRISDPLCDLVKFVLFQMETHIFLKGNFLITLIP